jgi:hypothetical protein
MFARLAGALVTRELALETREPSYVPRTAKPSQQGGGAQSRRTRDDAIALSNREARSGAEGRVAVPELISVGKRGSEP